MTLIKTAKRIHDGLFLKNEWKKKQEEGIDLIYSYSTPCLYFKVNKIKFKKKTKINNSCFLLNFFIHKHKYKLQKKGKGCQNLLTGLEWKKKLGLLSRNGESFTR